MKYTWIAVLAALTISCSDGTPTSPSAAGVTPGPRQTLLPEMLAPLTGIVSSAAGTPIANATVRVLDGFHAGVTATTDGNGQYRFERLPRANANFSATAVNYIEDRRGTYVDGSNALNFTLDPTPLFTRSGMGNDSFELPATVTRVRVNGQWSGNGSATFNVRIAGRTAVNQNIRTARTYEGEHAAATRGGGLVEILNSPNVSWTITEVR